MALSALLVVAVAEQLSAIVAAESPDFIDARTREETFDYYWQKLDTTYPYFDVYGVDWNAARQAHRNRALSAVSHSEFIHEVARMLSVLADPHLLIIPPFDAWEEKGVRWTMPRIGIMPIRDRWYVATWPDGMTPNAPEAYRANLNAFPEIIKIGGARPSQPMGFVLAAGPPGTEVEIELEWPDGTRTTERLVRPDRSPFYPRARFHRDFWAQWYQQDGVGYLAVSTFAAKSVLNTSLHEMRLIVGDALAELINTDKLIIDVRYNRGGELKLVNAVMNQFISERIPIKMLNANGVKPAIIPREPTYSGEIIVLTNEYSGSGGEWFPAFMRRYAGAQVVGGRTAGAEAGVAKYEGADGSVLKVGIHALDPSHHMTFQGTGVTPDVEIPLTVDRLRERGLKGALLDVERERVAKALEMLDAGDVGPELGAFIDRRHEALLEQMVEFLTDPGIPELQ